MQANSSAAPALQAEGWEDLLHDWLSRLPGYFLQARSLDTAKRNPGVILDHAVDPGFRAAPSGLRH